MNHTRFPLVKLITCTATLALGGGATAAADHASGPGAVRPTAPTTKVANTPADWCDIQLESLFDIPFPDPSAEQIANYSSAWRTALTTTFVVDDAGPSPVTEVGTIDEAGAAAISVLDEMDALASEGDLDGAVIAAQRVDDLVVHRLAAVAIAGNECGWLEAAESAAASTFEVPLLGGWQVGSGFGSIWIAREFTNLVERIDPATGEHVASIDVGAIPVKMQPADGRLWVRTADAFVAVDPATNAVDATIRKADVGAAANRSWAVDGALWICDGNSLHRYDPTTLGRITTLDLEIECGNVYAADELAVAWTDNGDEGESGTSAAVLIDPASNDVVHTVSLPMDASFPVVLDDVVYFAGNLNQRAATIDRTTGSVTEAPSLTRTVHGSQTAFDGEAIYVLAKDTDEIMVVDAETFEMSGEIPTLGANSIEVLDGKLWTANNISGFTQAFDTIAAVAQLPAGSAPGAAATDGSSPPTEERIPDGSYSRVATVESGIAAGLDPEVAATMAGPHGEEQYRLVFDGDTWQQYGTSDLGIEELGDSGTTTYTEDGRWLPCPDCEPGVDWTFEDGELTLRFPFEVPDDVRFVMEGTYQLDGATAESTEPNETVTLRFANPLDFAPPQLVAFVEEVQRLSDGTIEFEWLPAYGVDSAGGAYSDAEATLLTDLADSTVDIGWVGARALPNFDALLAPLLVDSHDLQQAVFDAGIPQRMLADLDVAGLTGIAVLPGPLRRLMGVEHSFAVPADFNRAVIANDRTAVAEATMAALGATPVPGASELPLDGLDAVLAHFQAIVGNGYETQADSVVANLNFWPRPLAVVMSADSFAALTPEQQDVLLTAGAMAVGPAMEASRDEDASHGAQLCDGPIEVIESTGAERAEFDSALEPVYSDLESDPTTAAYLNEIIAMKEVLRTPPDTLTCPNGG